jgi:type III pantothenate kinase
MSILLVDAGNARLKWALDEAGAIGSTGQADYAGDPKTAIARMCATVDEAVEHVVIGNVAGREFGERLEQALRRISRAGVWFAQSRHETAGVRCAYAQPQNLGVDRWAAIVAAVHRMRAHAPGRCVCVVDAGTALTIDVVDHEAQHLGGLILPGLYLQRHALLGAAADIVVSQQQADGSVLPPGVFARTTAQALAVSGPFACAAAVDRCVAEISATRTIPWVVVTGGDAQRIAPWLATPFDICPNLVFEGLAVLFEQRSLG